MALKLVRIPYTHQEINAMALALLEKGLHPSKVRDRLQEHGISWHYQYLSIGPTVGRKERLRNLKRQGLTICQGCNGAKAIGAILCPDCLEKKWSPEVTITRGGE